MKTIITKINRKAVGINGSYFTLIKQFNQSSKLTRHFSSSQSNSSNSSNQTESQTIDTDVIVLGGGVVGLAAASALSRANITDRIILLDQQLNDLDHGKFTYSEGRIPDTRVVSLTPGSMRFLQSIGVTEHLDSRLLSFVDEMQVWEAQGPGFVNVKANEVKSVIGMFRDKGSSDSNDNVNSSGMCSGNSGNRGNGSKKYISCILEINHLTSALQRSISCNNSKITKLPIKLDLDSFEINHSGEYTYLTINNNTSSQNSSSNNSNNFQTYRTKLLLISDGPRSLARTKLNIPVTGYDYNETGLVCTLKGNTIHKTAYQRFLHNGIFALLPMHDDYYSIVSSMPTHINEQLLQLDEKAFLAYVNNILQSPSNSNNSNSSNTLLNTVNSILNNITQNLSSLSTTNTNNFSTPPLLTSLVSKRLTFPLSLQFADTQVHRQCVMLGDSAHQVHPLAGQGLNLGITDVAVLAEQLSKAKRLGKRLGDAEVLADFAWRSQCGSKSMIASMEAVKMVFRSAVLSGVRSAGMGLVNGSDWVKGALVDAGSGGAVLPERYDWERL